MKSIKTVIIILILFALIGVGCLYVYIGTYVFPIAPYWVTQLPPNPPKPKITHGEFDFKMKYKINSVMKEISDTLVCDFNGFEVYSVGDSKKRVWSENLKNSNNCELFHFRDEERENKIKTYSSICIENLEQYKVVLVLPEAEWFLNEPTYKDTPDMPCIYVYDTVNRYYLDFENSEQLLKKHNFEIIDWDCERPVENEFK